MASASGYNYHRFARAVLKKARKWEPSLTIQLYASYWRFEHSQINFLYDGPMKPFLLALRAQVIPASLIPFLYDIRPPVSFVDGCLVVEVQDFRKVPEVRSRVVMRPAPETLPQTIDVMLERRRETWDEHMALELESRIIAATSAPLYLGTSILATRNAALSLALTAPAGPNLAADGTFRPTLTPSADEGSGLESVRKLIGLGSKAASAGTFQPNWSVLRLLERIKLHNRQKEHAAARAESNAEAVTAAGSANGSGGPSTSAAVPNGSSGPGEPVPEKKKSKKKRPAESAPATEGEKKPAKKKKTAAATAAAAAATTATATGDENKAAEGTVPEPKKKAVKKDGETPSKPKKKAAKKKEEE